jgi:uncharacterized membrane protein YphA (DoxX/SURF4 family)
MTFGWRVLGLGVMAMGLVNLAWGNFDADQPVPKAFPERLALAYAAAAFLTLAGAAVEWRRITAWGAASLAVYFAVVVALLMNGRVLLAHPAEYGAYSGLAEPLALAAGALIVYAETAGIDAARAAHLGSFARRTFGVCAVLFGGAHFAYMNLTAPLVPTWLPPSQEFWAIATGVAHMAAGVAILSGVQARLAAILLTVMYAAFTPLVHLPLLLAAPGVYFNWTENALNLALVGAAWVVADSLGRPKNVSLEQPRAALED